MRYLIVTEIRKVFTNKFFIICLALVVGINGVVLLYGNYLNTGNVTFTAYRKLGEKLSDLTQGEKRELLTKQYRTVSTQHEIEELYKAMKRTDNPVRKADLSEQVEKIKEQISQGMIERDEYIYTESLQLEYDFLSLIIAEFNQVDQYSDFLDEVQNNTNTLSEISLFQDKNSFEYVARQKIAEAYHGIGDVSIQYFPQKAIRVFTESVITDILIVLGVILLSALVVRYERDNGLLRIVRSTKLGRIETALAKLITISVGTFILVFSLYLCNFVLCNVLFGFGDLSRTVQSIPFLMRTPFTINVWQYFITFVVAKWAASFIFGAVVLIIMIVPERAFVGYVFTVVYPLLSLLARVVVPASGSYNVVKYLNPISLLVVNDYLCGYRIINLLGMPISFPLLMLIFAVFVLIITAFVFCLLFCKMTFSSSKEDADAINWQSRKEKRIHSLIFFEFKKLGILNGVIMVVCVFAFLNIYQITQFRYELSADEMYYRYYMKALEGRYNASDYDWLTKELEKFEPFANLQTQLQNHIITQEQYDTLVANLPDLLKEYNVVRTILPSLRVVAETPSKGIVYDTGYKVLFGFIQSNDISNALMTAGICVLCFSGVFPMEFTSGMFQVIKPTKLGIQSTIKAKRKVSTAFVIVIVVISYLPQFWLSIKKYGLGGLWLPLNSMNDYVQFPSFISIIGWILFLVIIRLIVVMSICNILFAISVYTRNSITTIFLGVVLFILPIILYVLNLEVFEWFSIYPLFRFGYTIKQNTIATIGSLGALWLYSLLSKNLIDNTFADTR